jgi:cell division protein FtsB
VPRFAGRLAPDAGRTLARSGVPVAGSDQAARAGRKGRGTGFAAQDFFWIVLAGSIAGFVLLVFRPNRDRIRAAEAECRLLRQEITALESDVAQLRSWERALGSGDAEAWGAVARSRAGWVAPGERVMRTAPRGARVAQTR